MKNLKLLCNKHNKHVCYIVKIFSNSLQTLPNSGNLLNTSNDSNTYINDSNNQYLSYINNNNNSNQGSNFFNQTAFNYNSAPTIYANTSQINPQSHINSNFYNGLNINSTYGSQNIYDRHINTNIYDANNNYTIQAPIIPHEYLETKLKRNSNDPYYMYIVAKPTYQLDQEALNKIKTIQDIYNSNIDLAMKYTTTITNLISKKDFNTRFCTAINVSNHSTFIANLLTELFSNFTTILEAKGMSKNSAKACKSYIEDLHKKYLSQHTTTIKEYLDFIHKKHKFLEKYTNNGSTNKNIFGNSLQAFLKSMYDRSQSIAENNIDDSAAIKRFTISQFAESYNISNERIMHNDIEYIKRIIDYLKIIYKSYCDNNHKIIPYDLSSILVEYCKSISELYDYYTDSAYFTSKVCTALVNFKKYIDSHTKKLLTNKENESNNGLDVADVYFSLDLYRCCVINIKKQLFNN